ncbi:MAG: TetR family transcriptional regulator [Paenibacillus sp.]|jgi:hypothetical protein|nr:TetR family transcriptional regulator [Paenibacillus sp.]
MHLVVTLDIAQESFAAREKIIRLSLQYPQGFQFIEQYSFSPYIYEDVKKEAFVGGWYGPLEKLCIMVHSYAWLKDFSIIIVRLQMKESNGSFRQLGIALAPLSRQSNNEYTVKGYPRGYPEISEKLKMISDLNKLYF